jgi:uncharacterized protein YyaL (SSP411 family)
MGLAVTVLTFLCFISSLKTLMLYLLTTTAHTAYKLSALDFSGLMITGFAKAGQALGNEGYIQRAITAANFVKKHLYNPTAETLLRSCYRGTDGNIAQL